MSNASFRLRFFPDSRMDQAPLSPPTGIGDLITYNSSVADYPKMFAAIASIVLFAALTIQALERLERKLFPPEMRGFEDVS